MVIADKISNPDTHGRRLSATPNESTWVILFLALLSCFYVLTRTQQLTFDSINYLLAAQNGLGHFYHPHHLIFSPLLRSVYLMLNDWAGWDVNIVLLGQLHNIFWSVMGLYFIYHICRVVGETKVTAWISMGLLSSFFYYWHYATQGEVYTPAAACLLFASYLLFDKRPGIFQIIGVILLWAMAVLYHQTAVLFVFPLSYYFISSRKVFTLLVICAASGGIVLASYLAAVRILYGNITPGHFADFVFRYYRLGVTDWGTLSHFSLGGLKILMESYQKAVAGSGINSYFNILLSAGLMILAVVGAISCIRSRLKLFLAIWIVTQCLFALWWLPLDAEFLIISLPVFALFAAIGLTRHMMPGQISRVKDISPGVVVICLLLAINFPEIHLLMNPIPDIIIKDEELLAMAPPNAVIALKVNDANYEILFQHAKNREFLRLEPIYEDVQSAEGVPEWMSSFRQRPLYMPFSALCPNAYATVAAGSMQPDKGYKNFIDWLLLNNQGGDRKVEIIHGKKSDYLFISDQGIELSGSALIDMIIQGDYCMASKE